MSLISFPGEISCWYCLALLRAQHLLCWSWLLAAPNLNAASRVAKLDWFKALSAVALSSSAEIFRQSPNILVWKAPLEIGLVQTSTQTGWDSREYQLQKTECSLKSYGQKLSCVQPLPEPLSSKILELQPDDTGSLLPSSGDEDLCPTQSQEGKQALPVLYVEQRPAVSNYSTLGLLQYPIGILNLLQ